ncbi:Asp-tRNA(Asn)/Glu-tRNA(Gln) amidotransferase A subunit family amidase [Streptomonospora salina]|uniref:Asp-tRNA(Asn)/Glu-tRNA(Gln) amidotransferase A subunit family amidase n=1 Tax=Streptomonospora salina TaxID=104205 RepID=A0A841E7B5_9ACTN|nr:amidase family protein [Streptomonospora salina]MBB5998354.1 Asp-tRNA(Asn)/Glu-tRNA(Gln) amidotransferase A subunit family amidase [Streptomonospora salina]
MMEFACGMIDDSTPFPVPRNPWHTGTWPGGSSSGTGSGVAAGFFHAGLGTTPRAVSASPPRSAA